jgi:DNA-binding response OmpR family regulator
LDHERGTLHLHRKLEQTAVKNLPNDSTDLPKCDKFENGITQSLFVQHLPLPVKKSVRQDPNPEKTNNAPDESVSGTSEHYQPPPGSLSITAHILMVEDNAAMRFYLRQVLGPTVSITETENGRQALTLLKSFTPDLIISDIMMPEMDGYQFLSALKSDPHLRTIPVIMVTSRSSEEDLLQGLSLGIDDYIIKPFNETELRIRVFNLLANQRMRKEWHNRNDEQDESDSTENEPAPANDFVAQVQKFVEERLKSTTLGIADLADHLALSERQLYRKCATFTGLTPAGLIKEIRLKMAYKMLLDKRVSKITDLASRVGFENSAYFSRQFFERYGKKPVEFLS